MACFVLGGRKENSGELLVSARARGRAVEALLPCRAHGSGACVALPLDVDGHDDGDVHVPGRSDKEEPWNVFVCLFVCSRSLARTRRDVSFLVRF